MMTPYPTTVSSISIVVPDEVALEVPGVLDHPSEELHEVLSGLTEAEYERIVEATRTKHKLRFREEGVSLMRFDTFDPVEAQAMHAVVPCILSEAAGNRLGHYAERGDTPVGLFGFYATMLRWVLRHSDATEEEVRELEAEIDELEQESYDNTLDHIAHQENQTNE